MKECPNNHKASKKTLLTFVWVNDFIGVQSDEDETLALANCPVCKTTLSYPLKKHEE